MSSALPGVKCQLADPCPDCASGLGHPPAIEKENGEEICTARLHRGGPGCSEGDICGYPAQNWAGDIPLCMLHYRRFKAWVTAEDDLALERDARVHEQRLRHQQELSEQSVQLRLERIAALKEAKAAASVVYYLRRVSDGMVKIGFSASPKARLDDHRREQGQIQVLLVHGGDRGDENSVHNRFREYRIGRTEWFRPVRPLLNWICEAREEHTHPGVQPDDILPIGELRQLAAAAVPIEDLRFDEDGHVIWPPETAAA